MAEPTGLRVRAAREPWLRSARNRQALRGRPPSPVLLLLGLESCQLRCQVPAALGPLLGLGLCTAGGLRTAELLTALTRYKQQPKGASRPVGTSSCLLCGAQGSCQSTWSSMRDRRGETTSVRQGLRRA